MARNKKSVNYGRPVWVRVLLTNYPAGTEFYSLVIAGGKNGTGRRYRAWHRFSVCEPMLLRVAVGVALDWARDNADNVALDDSLKDWL